MREEDSNWFSRWEEDLPSPDELIPLSQTLITPHLASAFDIRSPGNGGGGGGGGGGTTSISPHQPQPNSSEFDSSSAELGGMGGVSVSEEPARTLKRPRLVWTPQLHKRFVDAVAHLGIKNAVPKTIMQLMSVDGLTRENVASHLQKYRLYLKRMQGINNGTGPNGPVSGLSGSGDSATDRLFASQPVPAHFLHPVVSHHQIQGQYTHHHHHHHRQMGHFGSGQGGGPFDHAFLARQAQLGPSTNIILQNNNSGFGEDVELGSANNGRKVLTLFPTADD